MNDKKKILVKYRIEQAEQAIQDAQILLNENGSLLSVINRVYYGMFYAILSLLVILGKGSSKHSGIISLFDVEFVRKGIFPKKMSQNVHKNFNLRQVSDYKELVDISIDDAKKTITDAREFVNEVKKYLINEKAYNLPDK